MLNFLLGRWPNLVVKRKGGVLSSTSRIISLKGWSWLENLFVDEYVYIGPNARLYSYGGITISKGVIAGPNLTIYTSNHDFYSLDTVPYSNEGVSGKKVEIGVGCWLGDSVMLMPGTVLGAHCLVGAGSILRGSFPEGSIINGNPAKVVKSIPPELLKQKNIMANNDNFYMRIK